ncbi:AFH_G0001020.mRNA.1.CDS.1 [Saccharomyces cerevisiae]|nr:BMC_2a_G0001060.mRNA.1.CDS.1 [Saccharomyces cerevisiae]CAI4242143.1 BMB_G0001060.mRNA.1.CDS.1 [Saccharomyces cerevisiae]CAI4244634.1 BAP_1a_G0000990.mRNA.1.CDS.1 [Saccharomyces cerevisiae]CAI4244715.1 CDN_1a_G0000930.mRNA.1.CDS.1 [Saccharomyces cerevisiae]CAI4246043.1 ALH_1b_G0000990.mRNA.1.CDS.1 [Saccharomyces cerevisiae]
MNLSECSTLQTSIIKRVQKAAEGKRVSKAPVASAWDKCKGCYPIIGLGSIGRARESIDAFHVKLTGEDIAYLEEVCKPRELQRK